jgi:hypothetical protein
LPEVEESLRQAVPLHGGGEGRVWETRAMDVAFEAALAC